MPKASKTYVFCPVFFSAFYMPTSKYLLIFCILYWQFSICHYKSSPHSFPSYLWPGKRYSVEYWAPLPPDFLMDLASKRHCERLKKTGERDQGIISAKLSGYLLLPAVKRFAVAEFINFMAPVRQHHFWDCISNWMPIKSSFLWPLGPWDDNDFLYFLTPGWFTFTRSPINLAHFFLKNPLIKYFNYSLEKASTHFL